MIKSILIVDDSPRVRTLLRWHLELRPGLEVCGEASDGIEAVEKAQELSPDLIVMDFSMPRMNGVEAARELKHKMPHVPIILFTAYGRILSVSEAIEAGISAIVPKGQSHKLMSQIMDILKQRGWAA